MNYFQFILVLSFNPSNDLFLVLFGNFVLQIRNKITQVPKNSPSLICSFSLNCNNYSFYLESLNFLHPASAWPTLTFQIILIVHLLYPPVSFYQLKNSMQNLNWKKIYACIISVEAGNPPFFFLPIFFVRG